MTTLAYCATEADGRINNKMMYMGDHIRPQLTDLITDLKALVQKYPDRWPIAATSQKHGSAKTEAPQRPFSHDQPHWFNGRHAMDRRHD